MIEKIFFNLEKCREKYIFLHEGQTWISSCEIWKPVGQKVVVRSKRKKKPRRNRCGRVSEDSVAEN